MTARTRTCERRVRPACRRRGLALVETAMAIPLLATILVGTMFLGWAMMNQQQVKASARYVSWRHANRGWAYTDPGPAPNADPNAADPTDIDDPNHPGLNRLFFRDRAVDIDVWRGGGQNDEVEDLVTAAGAQSAYASDFANRLLVNPYPDHGVFPRAQAARVGAEFGTDVAAFRKYTGSIRGYHIRDGVEWRRNEAGCRYVTRKQFLDNLDQVLTSVPDPGTEMGKMIRGTYVNGW